MNARDCGGLVGTLPGEKALFTGTVTVDGSHMDRIHCRQRVLNHGDLGARSVTDPEREYSQKLVFAEQMMSHGGLHIHVIDSLGFEALLHGLPARCHRLRERNGVVRAEAIIAAPARRPS